MIIVLHLSRFWNVALSAMFWIKLIRLPPSAAALGGVDLVRGSSRLLGSRKGEESAWVHSDLQANALWQC